MRLIIASLLLALSACAGCATSPHSAIKPAAVRLDFPGGGVCSATAVARYALLSATHCFKGPAGSLKANGVQTDYVVIAEDGKDHVLVRISAKQAHIAKIGPRPSQGDAVYMYGNPMGLDDMLRFGRVAHVTKEGAILADLNIYRGDSGAAVLDSKGRIVGVVSGMLGRDAFSVALALPIVFTKEQWAEALS